MRFSTSVAALTAIAPLANAHGNAGIPTIAGLHKDLKARELLSTLAARFSEVEGHAHHEHSVLQTRQNNDKKCGDGIGSCGPGECCSRANCKYLYLDVTSFYKNLIQIPSLWYRR